MSGKLQYTCLEDLNKAVTAKTTSGATSKMLLNSLGKLFDAAVNSEKQNNEEMAYILYMRFLQVVGNIRKTSDYKKDQKYFDNMMNQQRFKQALAKAETISQSLELQYKKIEAKTAAAVRVKQITPPPKLENGPKAETTVKGTSKPDMMIMEPNDVIKLMSEKCTTFIIMDVRDSDEFRVSQIKHSNVMNVPGEILKPGVTAKNIERQLHIEQRGNWSRKGKMDKVILVDWTSESIPIGDDSSKLNVLKDALLKWDTDMVKCHKPIYMINGGFENFGLQYPMFTTNPGKVRAPKAKVTPSVDTLLSFNNIEYPDLDNGFIASPSPASSANSSLEVKNGPLYPSTNDLPKVYFSGAITLSSGLPSKARNITVPPSAPALPDRSKKPAQNGYDRTKVNANKKSDEFDAFNVTKLSDSLSSSVTSLTSVASEMNNGMIESDTSDLKMETGSKPVVDRSLKAKLLLKTNESSRKDMSDVIDAQRDLVEETVLLEKRQLEMENRWEIFRLQREKNAEEDMKLEVMKKEDALLEEMQRMLEDKERKEIENQSLRNQLEALKAKMKEDSMAKYESEKEKRDQMIAAAHLAKMEKEKQELKAQVEKKRKERLKQQKERDEAEMRIKEAEKRRKQVELELEEKEKIRQQTRDKEIEEKRRLQAEEKRREEREEKLRLQTERENEEKSKQRKEAEERDRLRLQRENQANISRVPLKQDQEHKSSLNRSHSSPNIAQMVDDENMYETENDKYGKFAKSTLTPNFSRTNKPMSNAEISHARNRDFQPVWGSNTKGQTGLRNLGNTCYMNSILQCLANIQVLARYFINRNYQNHHNTNSETRGEIAIEFAELVNNLWVGSYRSITPSSFKRTIGKFKSSFHGHDQQDAHELLVTLMEWLHNDVNEIKNKVKLPEQKNEGVAEDRAAESAWEMEKTADKSFIRELFYGQYKSSLSCRTCEWESVKYESFFELALQLPGGHTGRFTLEECIENFLRPENVTYTCPRCKKDRNCIKKFDIVRLPSILIVQLVRFYNDGLWRKKQNFIDFKLQGTTFGNYASACNGKLNRYTSYNLFAVCNHFGSMEGGHYTAYCLSDRHQRWFKYDDHEVTEMEPREVITPAAYVLFFSGKLNH